MFYNTLAPFRACSTVVVKGVGAWLIGQSAEKADKMYHCASIDEQVHVHVGGQSSRPFSCSVRTSTAGTAGSPAEAIV